MKKLPGIAILLALLISPLGLYADDGIWTFDNPPRKQWKARYDFAPTDAWLDHIRLASVRLNDGGSGAFVSPDGLLMTNQHVASGQLQQKYGGAWEQIAAAYRDLPGMAREITGR